MTNEEVIENLKYLISSDCTDTQHDFVEEIKIAIEALEKQIPKKPLHMHKNYYCPICKEDGWMLWDDAIPNDMDKYCGMCGQAIDWEEN